MKGIAVYLLITKHFYNNFKEKESDLRMATNRKLRILLKKIYPNGNIDTIFFKSRAKDVLVDESGTETLADIVEKVNDMNEGATKVEDSSTNGNIKINGTETNVYTHPNSGATAGTYNSVTVNAQGHVTAGTKVTNWTGTVSGNISNGTNTITKASTRANLTTGEKLSVSLGKVMKWFADLKSLAFVDKVGTANLDSTLTTAYNKRVTTDKVTTSTSITASGWVADARAVATLQNQIKTINSKLGLKHIQSTWKDTSITINANVDALIAESVAMPASTNYLIEVSVDLSPVSENANGSTTYMALIVNDASGTISMDQAFPLDYHGIRKSLFFVYWLPSGTKLRLLVRSEKKRVARSYLIRIYRLFAA